MRATSSPFGVDIGGMIRAQQRAEARERRASQAVMASLAPGPGRGALPRDVKGEARALAAFGFTPGGATRPGPGLSVPWFEWVDIYLSAGPNNTDGSCDADGASNCRLYRVRWHLQAGEAEEVSRVSGTTDVQYRPVVACSDGGTGEVEPALSPGETKLSYVRRCHRAEGGEWSELVSREVGIDGRRVVDPGGSTEVAPQWPAWVDEDTLVYTKGDNQGTTTNEDDMSTLWYAGGSSAPFALLGPGGLLERGTSFGDPDVHPSPSYRSGSGSRMVTFGGRPGQNVPRVTNLLGGERERFNLNFSQDADEEECHHPAWNISGDQILCHRHEPPEPLAGGRTLRVLYLFEFDPIQGRWTSPTVRPQKVFEPRTPAELETDFPEVPTASCVDYFYKYAEWCGSDDYVLVTLYCKDGARTAQVVASRVILVRIDVSPALYWDVTMAVEVAEGLPDAGLGTWRGVFGTCSAIHQDRTWTPVAG